LNDVRALIARAIVDEPPATLAEGGAIRPGFDAELDELRGIRDGAQDFIAGLQTRERERSGIPSLKVGYNKVFGYYLEVTRANLVRVPTDFERKQTLANAERFATPELKELEEKVLNAEDKIGVLEHGSSTMCGARLRRSCAGCRRRPTSVRCSMCWPIWPTSPNAMGMSGRSCTQATT
jgi:DNA mismatch repair protein MutS